MLAVRNRNARVHLVDRVRELKKRSKREINWEGKSCYEHQGKTDRERGSDS